ncbi:MAG: efflux transporter periplasmic adaptor subunit [Verrucomicrobiaceae bacterium]|nr:efflux transporter periplasmic adaptor subunit [Verrucomicrobiaceae bacterium]
MSSRQKIILTTVVLSVLVLIGVAIVIVQIKKSPNDTHSVIAERKALYWYDPMMPDQHFDKPGKSPFMDMQLIPRYADDSKSSGMRIDGTTQRNLAVRTALVERTPINSSVTAIGSIVFNERAVVILQTRANGFVQRVYAHAVGDAVKRGDPLVDLLIPEWAGVQQELIALKNSGDEILLNAARQRGLALGMTREKIDAVQTAAHVSPIFTVRAPQAGIIQTLEIREGMSVTSASPLLTINGIDPVWFEMLVPEYAATTIKIGDEINIDFSRDHSTRYRGKIIALLPELNAATRSVRVRAEVDNKNGALRIGQYAQAALLSEASSQSSSQASSPKNMKQENAGVLSVPAEAIIRGSDNNRVIVVQDDGSFAPQLVDIGAEINDRIEIRAGLHEGQRVVSSGQFMLDSEANLRGELNRMQPASAPVTTPKNNAMSELDVKKSNQDEHGAAHHD